MPSPEAQALGALSAQLTESIAAVELQRATLEEVLYRLASASTQLSTVSGSLTEAATVQGNVLCELQQLLKNGNASAPAALPLPPMLQPAAASIAAADKILAKAGIAAAPLGSFGFDSSPPGYDPTDEGSSSSSWRSTQPLGIPLPTPPAAAAPPAPDGGFAAGFADFGAPPPAAAPAAEPPVARSLSVPERNEPEQPTRAVDAGAFEDVFAAGKRVSASERAGRRRATISGPPNALGTYTRKPIVPVIEPDLSDEGGIEYCKNLRIDGQHHVGCTLTREAEFVGVPSTQWYRVRDGIAREIAGATDSTLTLTADDLGCHVRVECIGPFGGDATTCECPTVSTSGALKDEVAKFRKKGELDVPVREVTSGDARMLLLQKDKLKVRKGRHTKLKHDYARGVTVTLEPYDPTHFTLTFHNTAAKGGAPDEIALAAESAAARDLIALVVRSVAPPLPSAPPPTTRRNEADDESVASSDQGSGRDRGISRGTAEADDDEAYSDHLKVFSSKANAKAEEEGDGEEGDGEEGEEFKPVVEFKIRQTPLAPPTTDKLRSISMSFSAPPPPGGGGRSRGRNSVAIGGGVSALSALPSAAAPAAPAAESNGGRQGFGLQGLAALRAAQESYKESHRDEEEEAPSRFRAVTDPTSASSRKDGPIELPPPIVAPPAAAPPPAAAAPGPLSKLVAPRPPSALQKGRSLDRLFADSEPEMSEPEGEGIAVDRPPSPPARPSPARSAPPSSPARPVPASPAKSVGSVPASPGGGSASGVFSLLAIESIHATFDGATLREGSFQAMGELRALQAARHGELHTFSMRLEGMANARDVRANPQLARRMPLPDTPTAAGDDGKPQLYAVRVPPRPPAAGSTPIVLLKYSSSPSYAPIPLRVVPRWSFERSAVRLDLRIAAHPALKAGLSDVRVSMAMGAGVSTCVREGGDGWVDEWQPGTPGTLVLRTAHLKPAAEPIAIRLDFGPGGTDAPPPPLEVRFVSDTCNLTGLQPRPAPGAPVGKVLQRFVSGSYTVH